MILLDLIKHNLTIYGVISRDKEPSNETITSWAYLNKPVYRMSCIICSKDYWGRYNPKYELCGRFDCYKKNKNLASD
jgi:hypothetical protein